MTPTAVTAAARRARPKPAARSADHRPSIQRSTAPRAPRRVSGPTIAGAHGGALVAPAPAPRPVRLPRPRALPNPERLALRAGSFVISLPESTLLDRVIRGRIWIPLLGVLLVGIVGMQVETLKLNAGLGRSIEQTTTLQSRNDALRTTVAQLSGTQRIESIAARHGYAMAPPGTVRFVQRASATSAGDVARAVAGIKQPGSVAFDSPVGASLAASAAASPGSPESPTPVGG